MAVCDGLCQQPCHAEHLQFAADGCVGGQAKRGHAVGHHHGVDRVLRQGPGGIPGEQAVAGKAQHPARTALAQCLGGLRHGLAAGDQVVEQQHGGVRHIASDQPFAAHQAGTASFVEQGKAHRSRQMACQCLPPQLCTFHAARIGRGHHQRHLFGRLHHRRPERAMGFDVQRGDAKRILECRHVVGFQHHQLGRTHGLEQPRHLLQPERIKGLGQAVLAGIGQVGHHGADPRRAMGAQGGDEHQHATQLVMRAVHRPTVQAVEHIAVAAPGVDQGPQLVFTVLKGAVLMGAQRLPQSCCYRTGQARLRVEPIQLKHAAQALVACKVMGPPQSVRAKASRNRCRSPACKRSMPAAAARPPPPKRRHKPSAPCG